MKGTGFRLYTCERCERKERLTHAGIGYERECPACGGIAYCDPFPSNELMRRLDQLGTHLEAEDGCYDSRLL